MAPSSRVTLVRGPQQREPDEVARATSVGEFGEWEEDLPELPGDEVSPILEGIVYLDLEITTGVVVCRRLLVLGIYIWDWDDLWAGGGDDVLVLCAGLLRSHVRRR